MQQTIESNDDLMTVILLGYLNVSWVKKYVKLFSVYADRKQYQLLI